MNDEKKIPVLVQEIRTRIITMDMRNVVVKGEDIQDGQHTATVEVPLAKPHLQIDAKLTALEEPFVVGATYTDENGLFYRAISPVALVNVTQKVTEFKSPTHVICTGRAA